MTDKNRRSPSLWLLGLALAVLAGCSTPRSPAPVEERHTGARTAPRSSEQPKPPEPAASAPVELKPGQYLVKPGDTLMRIALDSGQSWRDIARWNNIDNPNVIEVGQILRVTADAPLPPATASTAAPATPTAAATKPVAPPRVEAKPLESKPAASAASSAASAAPPPSPPPAAAPRESDDDIAWTWPASGPVLSGFDNVLNKGVDIAGKSGDPVYAAASGRVIYVGASMRGYGNMVVIKHNNTYLTAYAHNKTILVVDDQVVRKGQKIAEMGSTDADRVMLHFEIRRQGKPVDPAKALPSR